MTATNLLLGSLAAADIARLREHCETVPLLHGSVLIKPDEPVEHVHFVEAGVLSIIHGETRAERIEVAMIGREGLSGHALALGVAATPYTTFVQFGGIAKRVPAHAFTSHCQQSPSFHAVMLRYAQAFAVQVAETARTNGRLSITSRLARWILMLSDRLGDDVVPVTHDLAAEALCVRRPGVTVTMHVLEGEHLIRSTRGIVEICNRAGLEAASLGSYGVTEAEYGRLIGAVGPNA